MVFSIEDFDCFKFESNDSTDSKKSKGENNMRPQLLSGLLVLAMAAFPVAMSSANSGVFAQATQEAQSKQQYPGQRITAKQRQALERLGPDVSVEFDSQEIPYSLTGTLSPRLSYNDPAADAQAVLETLGAAFRRRPNDELTFKSMRKDRTGNTRVEMAQTYEGIPVFGGKLVVYLSQDAVIGISGYFAADLEVDTHPVLAKDDVAAIVQSRIQQEGRQLTSVLETGGPVIVVNDKNVGRLAFPVRVNYREEETGKSEELFVDAQDGVILDRQVIEQHQLGVEKVSSIAGPLPPQLMKNSSFEEAPVEITPGTWKDWEFTSISCPGGICVGPFESSSVLRDSSPFPPPNTGIYKAWLGGWGFQREDSVTQKVKLPFQDLFHPFSAVLGLSIFIDTDEIPGRPGSRAPGVDYMYVEILDSSKALLSTLGYYNSFYLRGGYIRQTANISRYMGKTIYVRFRSVENSSKQTSFVIDDVTVTLPPIF